MSGRTGAEGSGRAGDGRSGGWGNWAPVTGEVVAPRMGEVDKLVRREVVAPGMVELGAGDGGSGRAGDGER